ncbi:hypothetical protein HDU76_008058 [Blyttiomyces sp. JEL0837]|nr:hypothetical protein HDU76_008058 [Blyttiomyces sp. JEL0837]
MSKKAKKNRQSTAAPTTSTVTIHDRSEQENTNTSQGGAVIATSTTATTAQDRRNLTQPVVFYYSERPLSETFMIDPTQNINDALNILVPRFLENPAIPRQSGVPQVSVLPTPSDPIKQTFNHMQRLNSNAPPLVLVVPSNETGGQPLIEELMKARETELLKDEKIVKRDSVAPAGVTGVLKTVSEIFENHEDTYVAASKDLKDSELTEVKDSTSRLEASTFPLEAQLSENTAELAEVKSLHGEVKSELGVVKSELAGVKSELGVFKSELAGVKSELAGVKAKVRENTSMLAEVKSELAGFKAQVSELTSAFENLCKEPVVVYPLINYLSRSDSYTAHVKTTIPK